MPKKTHFHNFEPHTLTKHAVLEAYLKIWATILIPKFRQIWFVDAFAGEGCDEMGNPGSPLIAAKVAKQINATHFPAGIAKDTGMRIVAFEADEDRFLCLLDTMQPYVSTPWWRGIAIVREGTLETKLDGVLNQLGNKPTLFFLDPFGIDGLSAAVLPKLLSGPQNEILLLFSDVGAVRLAGKTRAGAPDEEAMIAQAAAGVQNGLFPELTTDERERAVRKAKRSIAGHKSNPNAEAIMNTAFGGTWWQSKIFETPDYMWQERSVELYDQVLEGAGATYRLRFSVDAQDGQHKYFLVHASKSDQAYAAMKDAMHRARSKRAKLLIDSQESVSLIDRIATTTKLDEVVDAVAREFRAKSRVPWGDMDSRGTVKHFAIHFTPLWLHECDALKNALLRSGFTDLNAKGRPQAPLSFSFPT